MCSFIYVLSGIYLSCSSEFETWNANVMVMLPALCLSMPIYCTKHKGLEIRSDRLLMLSAIFSSANWVWRFVFADQFITCGKTRDTAHELASQIWLAVLDNLEENEHTFLILKCLAREDDVSYIICFLVNHFWSSDLV